MLFKAIIGWPLLSVISESSLQKRKDIFKLYSVVRLPWQTGLFPTTHMEFSKSFAIAVILKTFLLFKINHQQQKKLITKKRKRKKEFKSMRWVPVRESIPHLVNHRGKVKLSNFSICVSLYKDITGNSSEHALFAVAKAGFMVIWSLTMNPGWSSALDTKAQRQVQGEDLIAFNNHKMSPVVLLPEMNRPSRT